MHALVKVKLSEREREEHAPERCWCWGRLSSCVACSLVLSCLVLRCVVRLSPLTTRCCCCCCLCFRQLEYSTAQHIVALNQANCRAAMRRRSSRWHLLCSAQTKANQTEPNRIESNQICTVQCSSTSLTDALEVTGEKLEWELLQQLLLLLQQCCTAIAAIELHSVQ